MEAEHRSKKSHGLQAVGPQGLGSSYRSFLEPPAVFSGAPSSFLITSIQGARKLGSPRQAVSPIRKALVRGFRRVT